MTEHNNSIPLSRQADVGQRISPVEGVGMAEVSNPVGNWLFADAWPGIHGGEMTSYFAGTRTYMLSQENEPFMRSCNLVYVDGHVKFSAVKATSWDTDPY